MVDRAEYSKGHKRFPDGWHVRIHGNGRKGRTYIACLGVEMIRKFATHADAQTYINQRIRMQEMEQWFLYAMPPCESVPESMTTRSK